MASARPAIGSLRAMVGVAAVAVASVVVATGLLLVVSYDGTVDRAHGSMRELITAVPLGALLRALHRVGTDVLLVLLGVYLFLGLVARGRLRVAQQLATVGVGMVLLALSCSGELLPWDRAARGRYQTTVELAGALPGVGGAAAAALRRGAVVDGKTLEALHRLHVAPLPVVLIGLALALLRLRLGGGAEPQQKRSLLGHPALTMALAALLALIVYALIAPPALGPPSSAPGQGGAVAPWYLAGWQEVASYAAVEAAVFGLLLLLGLLLAPWLAGEGAAAVKPTLLVSAVTAAAAIAAVWWWRDPSYGSPTLINPATIAIGVALAGAAGARWWSGGWRVGYRSLIAGLLAAGLVFTVVGSLARGPGWTLTFDDAGASAAAEDRAR